MRVLCLCFLLACSVPRSGLGGEDGGASLDSSRPDVGVDASIDSGADTGTDGAVDAGEDSGRDGGEDGGTDAGTDAGFDAGFDAGTDAAVCTGTDTRCNGTMLEQCAGGAWSLVDDCILGCDDSVAPRCLNLVPSNVGAVTYVDEAVSVTDATWDTDVCAALPGMTEVVSQGGGEIALCLMRVGSLRLDGDVRVSGSRGLVIVAKTDVTIAGTLRANASGRSGGTGGADGAPSDGSASGDLAGENGEDGTGFDDGGGGGGGFCARGGDGGDGDDGGGGLGGGEEGGSYRLVPLRAGSGGGRGGANPGAGVGGGGGGAIQISAQGILRVDGTISVVGAGGGAGRRDTTNIGAGGGGGSGGAILLESATDIVFGGSASLVAGGGGGGGGASCSDGCTSNPASENGCDGNVEPICGGARGGACTRCGSSSNFGADGAEGGSSGNGADGDSNGLNGANGGGGGGGAGCIVLKSESVSGSATEVGVSRDDTPEIN